MEHGPVKRSWCDPARLVRAVRPGVGARQGGVDPEGDAGGGDPVGTQTAARTVGRGGAPTTGNWPGPEWLAGLPWPGSQRLWAVAADAAGTSLGAFTGIAGPRRLEHAEGMSDANHGHHQLHEYVGRGVQLSSTQEPGKECNMCFAESGQTVSARSWIGYEWRPVAMLQHLDSVVRQRSNVRDHHITLTGVGIPSYDLWQVQRADGDFVRCSTTGYENPGVPIPGSARVTGNRDCGLTVNSDGSINLWERNSSVEIPNFPKYLHDEHMHWHMTRHPGDEFLQFHRDFLARFHEWYDTQPFADQSLVAAWPTLPPEFNQPGDYETSARFADVRDVETNLYKWASTLHYGTILQGRLHHWLHHIPITTVYRDTLITNFTTAPTTRHFYQLHGLIDSWWQRWTDGRAAAFLSQQGVPPSVSVGQRFTATVTMQNTGRFAWPAGGTINLGSQDPPDNTLWGTGRVPLDSEVPPQKPEPGEPKSIVTFTIAATAPLTAGRYTFRWRMVDEGAAWFGDLTDAVIVNVTKPKDKETKEGKEGKEKDVGKEKDAAKEKDRDAGFAGDWSASPAGSPNPSDDDPDGVRPFIRHEQRPPVEPAAPPNKTEARRQCWSSSPAPPMYRLKTSCGRPNRAMWASSRLGDLSTTGWRQASPQVGSGTAVVGGRQISVRDIMGVLTRLPSIGCQDLEHVAASERTYVAAETTAFLLWWLSILPCPVLNRPEPPSLSAPCWTQERLVLRRRGA